MNHKPLTTNKGFTLIEAVIAIAIVGILGLIIAEVLSRSFKGSNKSQLLGSIKQNGQESLNSISEVIRSADNVVCPVGTSPSQVITLTKNGVYTRIFIKDQTALDNGYIAEDIPTPTSPSDAANLCDMSTYPEVKSSKGYLTDIDKNSGVSVKNPNGGLGGSFQVISSPGYKALVIVEFNLMPGLNSGNSYDTQLGDNGSLNFKTTIELR